MNKIRLLLTPLCLIAMFCTNNRILSADGVQEDITQESDALEQFDAEYSKLYRIENPTACLELVKKLKNMLKTKITEFDTNFLSIRIFTTATELLNRPPYALLPCDITPLLYFILNYGGKLDTLNALEALKLQFKYGPSQLSLPTIKFYVENDSNPLSTILVLHALPDNNKTHDAKEYLESIKHYVDENKITINPKIGLTIPAWIQIFVSRGNFAALNQLWTMTSKEEIKQISPQHKQQIIESAIRLGNLEIATELIARFGVALDKEMALRIIDNFPTKNDAFIRKAFAQVNWSEKAQAYAEDLHKAAMEKAKNIKF